MNVKILDFQNKKNKLKSRYIDSLKRCKSCSDGNIRMLKLWPSLIHQQKLNIYYINTTFYYFQKSDCVDIKKMVTKKFKMKFFISKESQSLSVVSSLVLFSCLSMYLLNSFNSDLPK